MKTDTSIPHQDEVIARNVGYFTLLFGLAILTISFLSSCHTTRGFGRDVQKVGSKIETAANRAMH
jgi:predicted small secreted protein